MVLGILEESSADLFDMFLRYGDAEGRHRRRRTIGVSSIIKQLKELK
jgi:hypothetical protein